MQCTASIAHATWQKAKNSLKKFEYSYLARRSSRYITVWRPGGLEGKTSVKKRYYWVDYQVYPPKPFLGRRRVMVAVIARVGHPP
jgi:hypothetical protein